jgi:hypothetical protein
MLHQLVWWILTGVSEELLASIILVKEAVNFPEMSEYLPDYMVQHSRGQQT